MTRRLRLSLLAAILLAALARSLPAQQIRAGLINLATMVTGVLPTANGGLGVVLAAPGADRILFWDDSAGGYAYLTAGTGLTITGTTITASGGGSGDVVGPAGAVDSGLVLFDGTTGKLVKDGGALGTGVLTFLGTPSSANLASAITDETGSGLAVFATSPTLTTPVIGVATGTSLSLSSQLVLPLGSAGTPAIISTDADSGLFWTTNTNLSLAVNGTEVMRFGSSGRLSTIGDFAFGTTVSGVDTTLARGAAGQLDVATNGSCSTASNCRDLKVRHPIASGTTPTIDTGCGTGTLATGASDAAGKITTNTTGTCTIVLTFGTAWARAPACHVTNETTANLSRATTTTTTATLAGTTVSGDVWAYSCGGY